MNEYRDHNSGEKCIPDNVSQVGNLVAIRTLENLSYITKIDISDLYLSTYKS